MAETTLIPTLGTHQADEIVLYPETSTQNVLPQTSGNGATPHSAMLPLSKVRIERNLGDVELNHRRDHEDDIYSVFSGEELPADMTCWYLIVGEEQDMLRLLCTVALPVPRSKWVRALLLCNDYHGQCRIGKCYLDILEGHPEARLFVDSIIDLSGGVSDSYLQRFIMLSLFAAHVFFEKTLKAKLLVPARSRKRSKPAIKKESSQSK